MGIVAKACLRLTLSLGCGVRAESRLFARGTGDRGSCVNLRGRNGRHSRLERLIGRAVRVQAQRWLRGLATPFAEHGQNGGVIPTGRADQADISANEEERHGGARQDVWARSQATCYAIETHTKLSADVLPRSLSRRRDAARRNSRDAT
jgi:hypothetical protein